LNSFSLAASLVFKLGASDSASAGAVFTDSHFSTFLEDDNFQSIYEYSVEKGDNIFLFN